ncbi:MAG: hypothetical protein IJ418_08940 [Clostridia bacterium]|nr:hypothetical protein [Clostridia bacterium]
MKITHIKKLCVEAHMCMIYDTDGNRQWIGTQDTIYPADELMLSVRNIATLFDMPDAESRMEIGQEEIWRSELVPGDCEIDFELERWQELKCGIPIVYLGDKLYPLANEHGGILFVKADYVKPAIRKNDYLVFKLTYNQFGHPLIVIGNGMETTGIVRPVPKKEAENLLDLLARYSQMQAAGSPAKDGGQYIKPEKPEDGQIAMEEVEEAENDEPDGSDPHRA